MSNEPTDLPRAESQGAILHKRIESAHFALCDAVRSDGFIREILSEHFRAIVEKHQTEIVSNSIAPSKIHIRLCESHLEMSQAQNVVRWVLSHENWSKGTAQIAQSMAATVDVLRQSLCGEADLTATSSLIRGLLFVRKLEPSRFVKVNSNDFQVESILKTMRADEYTYSVVFRHIADLLYVEAVAANRFDVAFRKIRTWFERYVSTVEQENAVKSVDEVSNWLSLTIQRHGVLLKGGIDAAFAALFYLRIIPRIVDPAQMDLGGGVMRELSAKFMDSITRKRYAEFINARWPETAESYEAIQKPSTKTGSKELDLSLFFGGKSHSYGSGQTRKVGSHRES